MARVAAGSGSSDGSRHQVGVARSTLACLRVRHGRGSVVPSIVLLEPTGIVSSRGRVRSSPFVTRPGVAHTYSGKGDGVERIKLKGWAFSSMDFDGERLRITRPPTGKTEVPVSMVEGFVFTNAAVGQPGLRVVVRGGSLHQSTAPYARVSDDPYLLPLTPGRKKRRQADEFIAQVMAAIEDRS